MDEIGVESQETLVVEATSVKDGAPDVAPDSEAFDFVKGCVYALGFTIALALLVGVLAYFGL